MTTQYFVDSSYTPPALIKRETGQLDAAFVQEVWRPTTAVMAWMAGENDFLDKITAAEARKFAPVAFNVSS